MTPLNGPAQTDPQGTAPDDPAVDFALIDVRILRPGQTLDGFQLLRVDL